MGHFRFRRKIGPFNVSKTGTSITTGVPGAHLNIPLLDWGRRKRSPMVTLGLPGTGLSYREQLNGGGTRRRRSSGYEPPLAQTGVAAVVGFIVLCVLYLLMHGGG
jgi:hypothetical protein